MSTHDNPGFSPVARALLTLDGRVVHLSDELVTQRGWSVGDELAEYLPDADRYLRRATTEPVAALLGTSHYLHISRRDALLEALLLPTSPHAVNLHHRAERAEAEMDHFLRTAAHDLAEPMRKIEGFSRLLEHRLGPLLDDDTRLLMEHLVDGARRARDVFDQLTTLHRTAQHLDAPEAIELERVARSLWPHPTGLSLDVNAEVNAPPDAFIGALKELLDNAARFTRRGEAARAHLSATACEDGTTLRLRDWGIGVPNAEQQRVFDRLVRLNGRSQYPGYGLGLARCRQLIELIGGRVWLESPTDDDFGTIAVLRLPH